MIACRRPGFTDEQAASASSRSDAGALPRRGLPAGAPAVGRGPAADLGVRGRRRRDARRFDGRLPAAARGGAGPPGRGPPGPGLAQGRDRARPRLPGAGHRRRHVGPPRRLPAAGRDRLRHRRENDDVSGTCANTCPVPGRQPEPQPQYRSPSGDWPYHYSTQPVLHRTPQCADAFGPGASGSAPRCSPPLARGRPPVVGPRAREAPSTRWRPTPSSTPSASSTGRTPGSRPYPSPARRSTRPLAPRRRPAGQAGGGHRHRRQRHAVRPRDRARGGRAAGVPAHARLDGAHPRLPRRGAARAALALRARAGLQRVPPVLHLLADGRRRPRHRPGRPRLGRARLGQRRQRHGPGAVHRLHQAAVRRPPRPARGRGAELPAGRQAHDPRQRRVGEGAEAGQRAPGHHRHPGDHPPRDRHGRRHRPRRGRDHLRDPSPPRSSSPR